MSDTVRSGISDEAVAISRAHLEQIATLLEQAAIDFLTPSTDDPLVDVGELLRLWLAIPDAAGRARVLAYVREAATGRAPA